MLDNYRELRDGKLDGTVGEIEMDVEDCREINERIFAGFIQDTMIKAFDPAETPEEVVFDGDSTIQTDGLRIS